jgi:hypothetical protein
MLAGSLKIVPSTSQSKPKRGAAARNNSTRRTKAGRNATSCLTPASILKRTSSAITKTPIDLSDKGEIHFAINRIPATFSSEVITEPYPDIELWTEAQIQKQLVTDVRRTWPTILMLHIPMNAHTVGRQAEIKKLGAVTGSPDFIILNTTKKYSFMALELKTRIGKPSPNQVAILNQMAKPIHNGFTIVAFGYKQAFESIAYYMEMAEKDLLSIDQE